MEISKSLRDRVRGGGHPDSPGAGTMVGRVVTPSAAIAVGRFLMVNPVTVLGEEREGAPGVAVVDSSAAVPVYLVGPHLAQQGEYLACRFINYRWVADRGGSTPAVSHFLTGCPCARLPDTFSMHVQSQPTNKTTSYVFPAAFQWMTKPAELAIYRTDAVGYYSTRTFFSSDQLYKFRYTFGCSQGLYYVTCLMTPDSPLGYPGALFIINWLVGLPGNTCTPFALSNGSTNDPAFALQGISLDMNGLT